jgi:hypothetical protein
MTTNLNVDNQAEDANDSPSHSVPSGSGGSIKDTNVELSQLLKAEIAEALKPVLSEVRGVQGRQDKDRTAFREFMDEFKKQKAKGLSDGDAEIAAEGSLKERAETQSDKLLLRAIAEKLGLSSAGNGTTPNVGVVEVLKQFPELDANDTDVVTKVLSLTDPKEAELAAHRLMRQRSNPTPPSASAASPLQGTPTRPAGVEQLTTQYQKDMIANRGKPEILRGIKEQAIKNGVPVDSVSFT